MLNPKGVAYAWMYNLQSNASWQEDISVCQYIGELGLKLRRERLAVFIRRKIATVVGAQKKTVK